MESQTSPELKLNSLHERHTGLTESLAGTFREAASVCLNRHHESPVEMELASANGKESVGVQFEEPDTRTLNAWANDIDTTEFGAYGICLAAVEYQEKLVAVRRTETQSGADWYIGPVGVEVEDLEGCFRLEVSGVDSGGKSEVERRLSQKVEQTRRGNRNLPALASVVGFKQRLIAIQRVSDSA